MLHDRQSVATGRRPVAMAPPGLAMKRGRLDGAIEGVPGDEHDEASPFDAVLAAANMASEGTVVAGGRPPFHGDSTMALPMASFGVKSNKAPVLVRKRPVVKSGSGAPSASASASTCASHGTSPSGSQSKPQADKGLRHFSTRVCAKVEEKGATSYNEVADELVNEIGLEVGKCDHKNIRRRVYDALNVLMAIDVIRKDKKEIRWLGLPNEAASEIRVLEEGIAAGESRLKEKQKTISELVQRLVSLKNLINRNALVDTAAVPHDLCSEDIKKNAAIAPTDRLPLPFILINAPRDCRVHCEMLEDRSQYFFEFDSPFLINEDIELLRLMGMDEAREAELLNWLPADLVQFIADSDQCQLATVREARFDLTLPEWDAQMEELLESMPPAIGGLAGLVGGDDGDDDTFQNLPPPRALLSSPIRRSVESVEHGRRHFRPSTLQAHRRL